MSTDKTRLEIGHVLFIDIVGYSKLLINEQSELFASLTRSSAGTEQFRQAEADGQIDPLADGRWHGAGLSHTSRTRRRCARSEIARGAEESSRDSRCGWAFTAARSMRSPM